MDASTLIKMIWPLIVIQLILQIYALIDVFKRKKVKNLSLPVWVIIILFGEIIGASIYLLFGRSEEE
jgi:uncharacterized membrane protein YcaP (DUF421 family)